MEQTAKRFDCYFQQTFRKLPEQVSLLLDSSSSGTIADHVECRETNKEQQWLKIIAIRTSPSRRMATQQTAPMPPVDAEQTQTYAGEPNAADVGYRTD
ncbi:MAG: hypothetical protein ACLUAM_07795 [Bifidobacterium adolescentis]